MKEGGRGPTAVDFINIPTARESVMSLVRHEKWLQNGHMKETDTNFS